VVALTDNGAFSGLRDGSEYVTFPPFYALQPVNYAWRHINVPLVPLLLPDDSARAPQINITPFQIESFRQSAAGPDQKDE
jgi:hypothetical protein